MRKKIYKRKSALLKTSVEIEKKKKNNNKWILNYSI